MNRKYPLSFYEWLWLLISCISGLSILLLVLERFNPILAVSSAVIIVVVAGGTLGLRLTFRGDGRFTLGLLAILMVALFFRWDPYPHQIVGQDQGLYVNMSKVYARFGGLNFKDPLREDLSEQQKKLYDANGGALFLSAIPANADKTKIQMCFYPLHPAWMAIFARGLGESYRGYSVVFFSLLVIVGLYLLTLEISKNQIAAYGSALFAALNPGLVFFTKFPVTEMVALAFTTNGFYFLYRGYQQLKKDQSCWLNFTLAAGCFNAFFYTRMSALLFIPFFTLLFICSLIDLSSLRQRGVITRFFSCLAVLLGLSQFFYYMLIPDLHDTVIDGLLRRFGPYRIPVFASIGVMLGGIILLAEWWIWAPVRRLRARNWLEKLRVLAPALILLALAVHPVWKIVAADHANFTNYWKFNADVPGWRMFFYSSIYRYFLYLSPIGFALLIIGPFLHKVKTNGLAVMTVVFVAFMMAVCWFKPYSPYAFYYDRYYLSEIIPYALMVVAIVLAPAAPVTIAAHWWRGGLAAVIAAYFAVFSWCQLGKIEGNYPDFFDEITKMVGEGDLLLYEEEEYHRVIKGGLVAYFNLKVFPVRAESELARPEIVALTTKFDKVYFLSKQRHLNPDLTCTRVLWHAEGFFIAGSHAWTDSSVKIMKNPYDFLLPFKHYKFDTRFYLYRLAQRRSP